MDGVLLEGVKEEGKKFIQPDIREEKFVSCDEMWTFVQKKKQKAWIWLCYSKMTKRILAVHIGNRGKDSAKKLIDQVPNMCRERREEMPLG
jgi:hypothetical protein